jgi:hypothetical protein
VQRLEDPAEVGQGVAELGWIAAALQDAHHFRRGYLPGVHRRGDAQDVGPVAFDLLQVDQVP